MMNNSAVVAISLAFFLGTVVGAWVAWARFLRNERPKVEIKVTQDVVATISSQMVMGWLNERGLVWMPKGVEFAPKVKR